MLSSPLEVPVLFLIFNRPAHAAASLQRLREVRPKRLYVHADGPRQQVAGEAQKTAATRAVLQQIDWECEVKTLFRETNMGLRAGVSDALDWFFAAEPWGIVMEDDCMPHPTFFRYCAELLERYADDPSIMQINGSNLAADACQSLEESYFFTHVSLVWGWASWRRAWQQMRLDLDGLEQQKPAELLQHFQDAKARAYLMDKFWVTKRRENHSWAYAWAYSILINQGLCISPRMNLVENTGIGVEGATNTTEKSSKPTLPAAPMAFPMQHPVRYQIHPALEQALFYAYQKPKLQLFRWYWLRKLGIGVRF